MTPYEEIEIYKPWPPEVINQAITDFNYAMHDGADVENIQRGLNGLDFLTRASTFDDNIRARLEGAVIEGEMRIDLLLNKPRDDDKPMSKEDWDNVKKGVELIRAQLKAIQYRIRHPTVDVLEYLADRRKRNAAN